MRIFGSKPVSVLIFFFFTLPLLYLPVLFGSGSSLIHVTSLAIYGLVVMMCLFNAKKFAEVLSRDFIFLLLMLFVVSASLWAYDEATSLRRVIALLGLTMVGYFWAMRFKLSDFVRIGFHAYSIIAVLSAFLILFVPHIGIQQEGYFIGFPRGIYSHKNGLGSNMLYACLFSIYFYSVASKKKGRLWAITMFCLSATLLIASKSSTSLVLLCACMVLFFAVKVIPKIDKLLLISLILMCMFATTLAAFLLAGNFDQLTALVGKDATLTGRTDLWSATWEAITEHPLIGYGFQTFWDLDPRSYEISALIGWDAVYAHNGILDTLIQIGFIGLSLFLMSFLKSYLKSFMMMFKNKAFVYTLPFTLLSVAILYNITETTIFIPNSINWALFVFAILSSRARLLDEKRPDKKLEPTMFRRQLNAARR